MRRNLISLKRAIRAKYAWPGGYPLSAITFDGAALCMDCCRKEWRAICADNLIPSLGWGWRIASVDVLWEGGNYCDHCNANLDAYQSDEEETG